MNKEARIVKALSKDEEKTFKMLSGMIDKYKAGMHGMTDEHVGNWIMSSDLAPATKQVLLDKLNAE